MKKNVFDVYYQSDNPEEIAKEKKKTESILSLLPLTSGGSIDKTNYVLLNDMANLQAELEEREYDISAGGGAVNLKINGKKQITELNIAPEIVDPDDVETLADIIIAAVNEGISKVEKVSETEMGKITGGMGMGMPGMPF